MRLKAVPKLAKKLSVAGGHVAARGILTTASFAA